MERRGRTILAAVVTAIAALGGVPVARAHEGSVHAGTPHWLLLGVVLLGVATLAAGFRLGQGRWRHRPRLAVGTMLAGTLLVVVGTAALVEIQVEPLSTDPTPIARGWFPVLAAVAGGGVVLASVNLGIWRWDGRPEYAAVGVVLGLWIAYPVLIPGIDDWHPLGYALVLALPVLVGVVLWREVRPALRGGLGWLPRWVGVVAAALFASFYLISTGQVTFNPDSATIPKEGFVVLIAFANPLVTWPAVEFYLPSVPVFGALSAGTGLTVGLLAGLAGVNAALGAATWEAGGAGSYSPGVAGGLAASGATACCCCAPAVYGVAAAALGATASPLYWAFLDPASPLGTVFFVAAVGLMTASAVGLADGLGACER